MSGGGGNAGPTEQELALANKAGNEFNDYLNTYVPLQEDFLSRLKSSNADAERRIAGGTSADVAAMTAGGVKNGVTAALTSGHNAASAADVTGSAFGAGQGTGSAEAAKAATDREIKGLTKITAFGRGLADQSNLGLRRAADIAVSDAVSRANAETQRYVGNLQGLGTAVGIGGAAYGREMGKFKADVLAMEGGQELWDGMGFYDRMMMNRPSAQPQLLTGPGAW